jgi:hypothetical protein
MARAPDPEAKVGAIGKESSTRPPVPLPALTFFERLVASPVPPELLHKFLPVETIETELKTPPAAVKLKDKPFWLSIKVLTYPDPGLVIFDVAGLLKSSNSTLQNNERRSIDLTCKNSPRFAQAAGTISVLLAAITPLELGVFCQVRRKFRAGPERAVPPFVVDVFRKLSSDFEQLTR